MGFWLSKLLSQLLYPLGLRLLLHLLAVKSYHRQQYCNSSAALNSRQ